MWCQRLGELVGGYSTIKTQRGSPSPFFTLSFQTTEILPRQSSTSLTWNVEIEGQKDVDK